MVAIKMKLFLVWSQYELACKYGMILQMSIYNERNCMCGLFSIADLLEVGEKKHFLIWWFLASSKPKWSKVFP